MAESKQISSGDFGVSLLPGKKGSQQEGAAHSAIGPMVFGIVLCVVLGIGGYLRITSNNARRATSALEQKLYAMQERIRQQEDAAKDQIGVGNVIGFAKSTLGSHVSTIGMFQVIEHAAIPDVVTLDQLALETKGTVVLAARANDYEAVVRQLLAWRQEPTIKDMRVTTVSARLDELGNVVGINFNATLTFMPELFVFRAAP